MYASRLCARAILVAASLIELSTGLAVLNRSPRASQTYGRPIIFQGRCRKANGQATGFDGPELEIYGGHCACHMQTATECFRLAQAWPPIAAAQYESARHYCALMHLDQQAPAECPTDCFPEVGTGSVGFYYGDFDDGLVCMPTTTANVVDIQIGTCRAFRLNGGFMHKDNISASDCLKSAHAWLPAAAVEYSLAKKFCNILQLQRSAPTEALDGFTAHRGSGTVSFYAGTAQGRQDGRICITSLKYPGLVIQQGACQQDGKKGGHCKATNMTVTNCFLQAQLWGPAVAAQYNAGSGACKIFKFVIDSPSDCPDGWTSSAGNSSPEFYAGNGDMNFVCLTHWL